MGDLLKSDDVDTGSDSSESQHKEPGRLTQFIIRRDKARLEQQYINAQSFLRKTEQADSSALVEEKNLREPEESSTQLSTYAKEAEAFLDKAFDDTIDDEELVLDGRSSSEGTLYSSSSDSFAATNNNNNAEARSLPDENDGDAEEKASVEQTLADLQRYAEEYGDFLSKELGDDDIEGEYEGSEKTQSTIGTDEIPRFPDLPSSLDLEGTSNASYPGERLPSLIPRGHSAMLSTGSASNKRRGAKYSFYGRQEGRASGNNVEEHYNEKNNSSSSGTELEEGSFNRANMRLYLNEVQSLIGRSNIDADESGQHGGSNSNNNNNEIMEAYNIMRKMAEEAEETVDLLERDNFCLKQVMDSYKRKYEEVLDVYSKAASSGDGLYNGNNVKEMGALQQEVELSRIEVDEAKMVIASLERKVEQYSAEIALKDYHLKNQQAAFFQDINLLITYIKQLSVQLEGDNNKK